MKKEIILRWIKKADNDRKVVEHLLNIDNPPTDVLCFHIQQAVEKYLKAYLTLCDVRIKKTHDLTMLLNLCIEKDAEFMMLDRDLISQLTIYAVEVRYPDQDIEPTIKEVKEFDKIANDVK